MPKFTNRESGIISLELELPREKQGKARFVLDKTPSEYIELPKNSVVVLAGCLLGISQRITLKNFMKAN